MKKTFEGLLRDPRTRVTGGTTCGGGALPPSTAPPTSAVLFCGGAGAGCPRLWNTLLGILTLLWLG